MPFDCSSSCSLLFYYYELVSKFNVVLKLLFHQGLSEPGFYCDLVYKFKKIWGMADFLISYEK